MRRMGLSCLLGESLPDRKPKPQEPQSFWEPKLCATRLRGEPLPLLGSGTVAHGEIQGRLYPALCWALLTWLQNLFDSVFRQSRGGG
jgi:hypothetical protein